MIKRYNFTPRNAGIRFATKNGTAGTKRIKNNIDHWLLSIPSLIFRTIPSDASIRALSLSPNPKNISQLPDFIGQIKTSNLTITEGIEEEADGTDSPGRHVSPTFGDFHLVWKNQKLKADAFLNYNGKIAFKDLAPSEVSKDYIYAIDAEGNPYSPSWYTLNLRSQYAITNALKATLSIENVTNQRYRSYSSGIAAPGTNLILGVGYHF